MGLQSGALPRKFLDLTDEQIQQYAEDGLTPDKIFQIITLAKKFYERIKKHPRFIVNFEKGEAKRDQWLLKHFKEQVEKGNSQLTKEGLRNWFGFKESPEVIKIAQATWDVPTWMKGKK